MPTPLLATKLHVPAPRRNAVSRQRLTERLNDGQYRKLTLVSAPAGSGKTTAIGEWLTTTGRPAAWLTLDEDLKDPSLFLAYLIAAVQTVSPHFGLSVAGALRSQQPPAIDAVLASLVRDLQGADPLIIVLDDYHALEARPVEDIIGWLVEHLPSQVHMVIATRLDPALPLARLRAKDQVLEVRAADLRFSATEATSFFNDANGLDLAPDAVEALVRRTEGWAAGLQLAGLSLRGHVDAAGFIASFTGSHRFVLDYLVEEVLLRQPQAIQDFLLKTSVLDRLCGSLCDALLQDPATGGQVTLEYLEKANLFLIPLDDERRWYRYHQLFADSLRQRLRHNIMSAAWVDAGAPATTVPPGRAAADAGIERLQRRASRWFEDHGLELEAFRHAAAANDIAAAERLMEGGRVPLHFRGAAGPVREWLESLPTEVLDARPSLRVALATVQTFAGVATNLVGTELLSAESALSGLPPDAIRDDLAGRIAGLRAMQAIPLQRVDVVMAESRRALDLLRPDNLALRTAATWTLGFAHQVSGDRSAAIEAFSQAVTSGEAAGNVMFTIAAATSLGQVLESENEAQRAADSYRRAVRLAGEPPLPACCEAHLGLARLYYEWNDLPTAWLHSRLSLQLARLMPSSPTPASCGLLLARLERARGDMAAATGVLAEAERFAHSNGFDFHLRQVADEQVRTLLLQGDVAAAADLADRHDLAVGRARVHLARGMAPLALALLQPLLEQARERSLGDELLRISILQALAQRARGDQAEALRLLRHALGRAEPAGFLRVFVDEGAPLARLLSELRSSEAGQGRETAGGFRGSVLAAFAAEELAVKQYADEAAAANVQRTQVAAAQPLDEPLTDRELEVLRLIAQGLSNADIGRRLFRALATVKGHNRMIFAKLEVQSRTEAVARARDLGLL